VIVVPAKQRHAARSDAKLLGASGLKCGVAVCFFSAIEKGPMGRSHD
jgi:hypothetical protein